MAARLPKPRRVVPDRGRTSKARPGASSTPTRSIGEETLGQHLFIHFGSHEASQWLQEYTFAKPRRWRFDYANPNRMLAVEIDGARWRNIRGVMVLVSRHTGPNGMVEDFRKMNRAAELGWRVLRFTPAMVVSREAIKTIEAVSGWTPDA